MLDWIMHIDVKMGEFIALHGVWIYALLFAVVFAETGLVLLPFLPGDTLLFAAGSFAGLGLINPWVLIALLFLAAVLGNTVNAWFARWVYAKYGEAIFSGKVKWLDHHALNATRGFFDKHGGKALVLARFVPVVRTFAPFVAGIAGMPWQRFQLYNIVGAAVWVGSLVLAGIAFGNMPIVRQYLNVIILVGIAVAVVPTVGGLVWKLLRKN